MPLPLDTPRLLIRPFTIGDAADFHAVLCDPEAMRFIPREPSQSVDETRERVERLITFYDTVGFGLWAVVEKASGIVIGDCGIFPVEGKGPEIELGYSFRRDRWNQGIATEAAAACLQYGLDQLRLPRIIALTYPDHTASRRVLEKIGMTPAGSAWHYNRALVLYEGMRAEG